VKARRYSEVQIFRVLQEVDAGCSVVDAARKHRVSPSTIHRWKSKYGGVTLSKLKRLKALVNELLREINAKMVSPLARKSAVKYLVKRRRYSQQRACIVVGIPRSLVRYIARPAEKVGSLSL